jgi:hypothetical protein
MEADNKKVRISKKYKRIAEIYRYFARHWEHILDFSDERMYDMYCYESSGVSIPDYNKNGYYHGKKWMDVTIAMWKEDLNDGILFLHELYEDENFPNWWLDKILK